MNQMKKKNQIDKLIKSIRRIVIAGFVVAFSLFWVILSVDNHLDWKFQEVGLLFVICSGIYIVIDLVYALLPIAFDGFKFKRHDEKEERNDLE